MPKVKRLNKIIHPKSRRALDLASKEHHKTRQIRSKIETKHKTNIVLRKLLWFKNAISNDGNIEKMQMDDEEGVEEQVEQSQERLNKLNEFKDKPVYTMADIHKMIDLYFHRFDDEIEQINVKKTIGKRAISQHFSREKAIEITLESDKNEYNTSGLVIPDLTNVENVKLLRKWKGESHLLPTIKLKPIKKSSN